MTDLAPTPPTSAPPPSSKLPLVALILACLFFVPLVPLVGAILGLVALGRVKRTPGMPGRGLAIASIPTGFVVFFLVQVALFGGMAVGFMTYRRGHDEALRTMQRVRQQQLLEEQLHRHRALQQERRRREQIRTLPHKRRFKQHGGDPLGGLKL